MSVVSNRTAGRQEHTENSARNRWSETDREREVCRDIDVYQRINALVEYRINQIVSVCFCLIGFTNTHNPSSLSVDSVQKLKVSLRLCYQVIM